jgi:dTDP-4-dehydrorhamnose reductase
MQFGIKGGYNFVDVSDISEAISNLLQINNSEDYLLTGKYVSIYEFYEIVNKELNKNKKTIKIPLFLVYPFIPFVPYLSKFVIKTINQNPNFDNKKFKQLLNRDITKFSETIKNTVEFFKNN